MESLTTKQKVIIALKRFIRGGLASAFAVMAILVTAIGVETFSDLKLFLNSLALAGVVGFITGFILAADKFFRTE